MVPIAAYSPMRWFAYCILVWQSSANVLRLLRPDGLTPGTYHAPAQKPFPQPDWQQDRQPAAEAPPAPGIGIGSSADNIFYAIVALLPELGLKHLQWARDEVGRQLGSCAT